MNNGHQDGAASNRPEPSHFSGLRGTAPLPWGLRDTPEPGGVPPSWELQAHDGATTTPRVSLEKQARSRRRPLGSSSAPTRPAASQERRGDTQTKGRTRGKITCARARWDHVEIEPSGAVVGLTYAGVVIDGQAGARHGRPPRWQPDGLRPHRLSQRCTAGRGARRSAWGQAQDLAGGVDTRHTLARCPSAETCAIRLGEDPRRHMIPTSECLAGLPGSKEARVEPNLTDKTRSGHTCARSTRIFGGGATLCPTAGVAGGRAPSLAHTGMHQSPLKSCRLLRRGVRHSGRDAQPPRSCTTHAAGGATVKRVGDRRTNSGYTPLEDQLPRPAAQRGAGASGRTALRGAIARGCAGFLERANLARLACVWRQRADARSCPPAMMPTSVRCELGHMLRVVMH